MGRSLRRWKTCLFNECRLAFALRPTKAMPTGIARIFTFLIEVVLEYKGRCEDN